MLMYLAVAANYLRKLQLRSLMKVATLSKRFSMQMKEIYIGRRCHLGLPQLERRQSLASKYSLTLLLEADTTSGFKLKPILIYHSKNPKVLKNYAQPTLPRLSKWTNKVWMTACLFTTWLAECLKPTAEIYCLEKKYYCLLTMLLVTQEL